MEKKRQGYKKNSGDSLMLILGVFLILVSGICFFTGYETSNDGVIEGRLVSVNSRVKGAVVNVYIEDGQEVKKGDLLLEIDSRDYQQQLKEAEAELNNAKVRLIMCEKPERDEPIVISDEKQSQSLIEQKYIFAKSDLDKFAKMFSGKPQKRKDMTSLKNFKKDEALEKRKLELQQNPQSVNNLQTQQAGEEEVDEDYDMIDTVELRAHIKKLEAKVADCKLNLSYTKVYASQDGTISARNVQTGDYVEVGQELVNLVPKRVWVVANYPSEKADKMREGQNVYVRIEDYPHKLFRAMVESVDDFNDAIKSDDKNSGFVPVRIVFTKDYYDYNFVPGMAVSTSVKVR